MTKDGGGKHQTSTSGALHNDTAYGLIEPGKNGNWKVVSRSALTSFMTAEKMDAALPMVRDPALRVALTNEWETVKASPSASQAWHYQPGEVPLPRVMPCTLRGRARETTCPCRKPYEVGHSTAPPALLTTEERDRLEAVL